MRMIESKTRFQQSQFFLRVELTQWNRNSEIISLTATEDVASADPFDLSAFVVNYLFTCNWIFILFAFDVAHFIFESLKVVYFFLIFFF